MKKHNRHSEYLSVVNAMSNLFGLLIVFTTCCLYSVEQETDSIYFSAYTEISQKERLFCEDLFFAAVLFANIKLQHYFTE